MRRNEENCEVIIQMMGMFCRSIVILKAKRNIYVKLGRPKYNMIMTPGKRERILHTVSQMNEMR